jgi:hypothetical protein
MGYIGGRGHSKWEFWWGVMLISLATIWAIYTLSSAPSLSVRGIYIGDSILIGEVYNE